MASYEFGLIKGVMFGGGLYNPTSPQAREFAKSGVPIQCSVCKDEYDENDPDAVRLFEVCVMPQVVGREDPEGIWVIFYCLPCIKGLFGDFLKGEPPPYIW